MSRNLTAAGCSSGEHVAACQCDVCLLRSELAEARSMHQDTLRAFEKYEQTSRAEHAAALGLATARIRELEGEREELLGLLREVKSWHQWGGFKGDFVAIVARIEKATKGTPR